LVVHAALGSAQTPPDLKKERADFAHWLATAPTSPLAAIAQQVIGDGLLLGPGQTDIPLSDIAQTRVVEERGAVVLHMGDERKVLPRGKAVPYGRYHLVASGQAGRSVLGVFGPAHKAKAPLYYPADPRFALAGSLTPPSQRAIHRILSPDGVETDATDAGVFVVSLGSSVTALKVYRIADPETEESDLLIYFRDATSGSGTYPAGRFVELTPLSGNQYLLDFNRASNPFCAYSSVYACPVPWPGNTLSVAVTAGEKYED
jgi:hypothetical protein